MGVADYDSTSASRRYINALTAPGSFDKIIETKKPQELLDAVDSGEINAAIIIEEGFGRKIGRGEQGHALVYVDGSDPQVAVPGIYNSKLITYSYSADILTERLRRIPPTKIPPTIGEAIPRFWYNPSMAKVNFYVPNLIGIIITQVTLILTALAIVREKELGNMELLLSSPIKPSEMILGKILPYLILAFMDVSIILLVATVVFRVPINGSVPVFFSLSALYVFVSLSVGMTFSNFATTQQQAMYMIMFYMINTFLLSGFIFPIITMPKPLQYFTYLVPLRYYMTILRGVITKGVSYDVLWPNIAALVIIGIVAVTTSLKTFKTTLD
jgi:ABC-2 type transport system permease protein